MLQDKCSWEEKSAGSRNYQMRIAAGTRSPAGGDFSVEKNAKSEVAAALRWEEGGEREGGEDNVNTCLLCSREGARWAEDKM